DRMFVCMRLFTHLVFSLCRRLCLCRFTKGWLCVAGLDPSKFLQTYERGSFAPILSLATAGNPQVGTAAPVGSIVYGSAPCLGIAQQARSFSSQVDLVGAPNFIVTVYGSNDGTNFYSLGTGITVSGIRFLVDTPMRYITAALSSYTGTPSADKVSVGLVA